MSSAGKTTTQRQLRHAVPPACKLDAAVHTANKPVSNNNTRQAVYEELIHAVSGERSLRKTLSAATAEVPDNAPPKPTRTFEQVAYDTSKQCVKRPTLNLPNGCAAEIVVCEPKPIPVARRPRPNKTPPPPPPGTSQKPPPSSHRPAPPPPPKPTPSSPTHSNAQPSFAAKRAMVHRVLSSNPSAVPLRLLNRSHDFEQTYARRTLISRGGSLRRTASDDSLLYAAPVVPSTCCCEMPTDIAKGGSQEKIYYDSSPVPSMQPSTSTTSLNSKKSSVVLRSKANVQHTPKSRKLSPFRSAVVDKLKRWSGSTSSGRRLASQLEKQRSKRLQSLWSSFYDIENNAASEYDNDRSSSHSGSEPRSPKDSLSPGGHAKLKRQPPVQKQVDHQRKKNERAAVIRQNTILASECEVAFRQRHEPQLFDMFGVICLKTLDDLSSEDRQRLPQGNEDWKYMPVISYSYPSASSRYVLPSADLLGTLPFLCYPDFNHTAPVTATTYKDQYFLMTVTDHLGNRKFAYCARFLDPRSASGIPEVLTIVSPIQATRFYQEVLREAVYRAKMQQSVALDFLQSIFHKSYPARGCRLSVRMNLARDLVLSNDASSQWITANTFTLLNTLASMKTCDGLECFLALFAALVCEKRVLLTGNSVPLLSICVQAAVSLLYPFHWPHTLIPVVPDSHLQLCLNPTPYIMGTLRSSLDSLKQLLVDEEEYVLILDLELGIVRDHEYPGDASENNSLPSSSLTALKRILKTILDDYATACSTPRSSFYSRKASITSVTNAADMEGLDERVSEGFLLVWVHLVGHYKRCVVKQQDGHACLEKKTFIEAPKSRSIRRFLSWFVGTGMFQVWKRDRMQRIDDGDQDVDIFDHRVAQLAVATSPMGNAGVNSPAGISRFLPWT